MLAKVAICSNLQNSSDGVEARSDKTKTLAFKVKAKASDLTSKAKVNNMTSKAKVKALFSWLFLCLPKLPFWM